MPSRIDPGEAIHRRYLMAIAAYDTATGRDTRGFRPGEFMRMRCLMRHKGNLTLARKDWLGYARRDFARYLVADGRIGRGDCGR